MKSFAIALACFAGAAVSVDAAQGWLNWRGPDQGSVSLEKGLPTQIDAKAPLWSVDFPGQSTPVVADGHLYINGYVKDGPDLLEAVRCFDAETGKLLWEHREADFLSDTIYLRYATSSPTVDPETGNVYVQFTQGVFAAFSSDGKLLWQHSLMEEYGRMTFPNSRTASPTLDAEYAIIRGITSSWGAHGPAGDRFYAFDKKTGELAWSSSPADRPQDNSFSQPLLEFWDGKRVLYTAGGDSSILALNARTGEPLWRFPFAKSGAKGGINAGLIRSGDTLIGVHESENVDSSEIGRMSAFRIPKPDEVHPTNSITPHVFPPSHFEVWRQPGVGSLASSPLVVDNTVYEVTGTGDLAAVDAKTGKLLWKKKLGIEQRQGSPFYANGYLYIGVYVSATGTPPADGAGDSGGNGDLFVLKPGPDACEVVSRTQLTGRCFGSPIGYNGKVYIQTDKKLYCFGSKGNNPGLAARTDSPAWPKPGPAAQLQAIPYEFVLHPGRTQAFRVRALDANGFTVQENVDPKTVTWEAFVPPTALVRAYMKAAFNAEGQLVGEPSTAPSGGQFKGTLKSDEGKPLVGFVKGRVVADLPLNFTFENFALTNKTTNSVEPPTDFAYPPLTWNSARFKFEVREKDVDGVTNKALIKTIDDRRFQRGQVFFGNPEMHDYVYEADVLSEGNKRKMSEVGIINQRYAIVLKGNAQQLEINSNQELFRQSVAFKWAAETWYRLKTQVDVAADGVATIRAKAWKKGDPEPDAWTIEVTHQHGHTHGSPGIYAFAPQDMRVAVDNISVSAKKK
ncbi:MAG TPA: PQQ-binding-like beta-propeller repeat protein [Candidatus Limnocylindria bacterium]|nr:PQQ-binding-like beta-propeller repeat protein [Candidatus Limnocylindria bacterium]